MNGGKGGRLLFLEAASFKPLAVLRIGIGIVLLVQAQVLWQYRDLLLAPEGPVPWVLSDALLDPWLPRLSYFTRWLAPMGLDPMRVVELFLLAHIVGAVLLIAGFRTRAAATLAWATYLPIRYSAHLYFYGIGGMLLIALFYCMVLPTGREWSVDRALAGRADGSVERELDAALSVGVLRIHLCIVYLAAGLSKAIGPTWWTGDAVWRALSLPRFAQFDLAALSGYPEMLQAAGLAAVVAQLAYPVLVWTRLRAAIVLLAELLHLGIAVFLGLWLFSAVMMVLNVAAFGESLWLALRRWRGAQHAPAWGSR